MEVAVVYYKSTSTSNVCNTRREIVINTDNLPDQNLIEAAYYYNAQFYVKCGGNNANAEYYGDNVTSYVPVGNPVGPDCKMTIAILK
jgi:hypothetical protein